MAEYIASDYDIHCIGKVKGHEIYSALRVWRDKEHPGILIIYGNGKEKMIDFDTIDQAKQYFDGLREKLGVSNKQLYLLRLQA